MKRFGSSRLPLSGICSVLLAGVCLAVIPTISGNSLTLHAAERIMTSTVSDARQPPKWNSRTELGRIPQGKINKYASRIDELVERQLELNQQEPHDEADDSTFVRRAYLDVIGRIPTLDETLAFLNSKNRNKHDALINDLLGSEGYASHQFNYFADLLRLQSRMQKIPGKPYVDFVKESIQKNKPFDQFVYELLSAEGPYMKRGNGATGYFLRDFGMPEDNMSNSVRIFLGTRLECAQCHDHPFDKWTQRDYFEMVAFAGGTDYRLNGKDAPEQARKIYQTAMSKKDSISRETRQSVSRMLEPITTGVAGSGNGLAMLPDDFLGSNGEPGEIITAKTMFEKDSLIEIENPVERFEAEQAAREAERQRMIQQKMIKQAKAKAAQKRKRDRNRSGANGDSESRSQEEPMEMMDSMMSMEPVTKPRKRKKNQNYTRNQPGIGSRTAYANWVVSKQNPRFATVIANRQWKRVMGMGLVEPVDEFNDNTLPSNPALLEYLSELMVELDFDLKQFQRVLLSSQTYGRETNTTDIESPEKYFFPGPMLRRMTGEQMWDSLLTMTVPDIDSREGDERDFVRYFKGVGVYEVYDAIAGMDADEILSLATEYKDSKRKSVMLPDSGDTEPYKSPQNRLKQQSKQLQKHAAQLRAELRKAQRSGDRAKITRLNAELKQLQQKMYESFATRPLDLVRASELSSPAPPSHFVRQFGQSDREQIENANSEPAVPQVLSLMNGFIEKRIANSKYTVLMKNVAEQESVAEKLDTVFLTMLNRYPTASERKIWMADRKQNPDDVASDLIWVLANASEFMFVR